MTEHTTNMLAAFHLASLVAENGPEEIFDTDVADAGNHLFGKDWTPRRVGRSVEYAPLVSMTLGRMRSAGLVRIGGEEIDDGQRYHSWAFTNEGRELAERMFGSAEDLLAAFPEPAGA